MAGQERNEMFRHANRANAGSAAAVRNAEGFVQVQMADVGADVAGTGETDLGVHVGAVHIDLSAVGVDNVANFADGFLEHAVSAGVGDHEAGEVVFVGFRFGLKVGYVNVSVLVTGDGYDTHSGHYSARRVGAMSRAGDQANVSMGLIAGFVIGADGEQSGVFALGTG